MKIKCKKCGYEWETESRMNHVTCPNCLLKVKLDKITIEHMKGGQGK